MAISLYDISVTSYLQTLDAVGGFLAKALAHFRDTGTDPEEIVEARLVPDMLPFRFQVVSVAFHSGGAMQAVLSGALALPGEQPAYDYAGLQALIADTAAGLRALTPEQVNAREGADMVFQVRDTAMVFTSEGFVTSFSMPNLHFHATTAYDILRVKGAPVGKRDYIGAPRLKG